MRVYKVNSENYKVWCASRRGLITAPNTKGQKRAEKGLKGNLNRRDPLVPFRTL